MCVCAASRATHVFSFCYSRNDPRFKQLLYGYRLISRANAFGLHTLLTESPKMKIPFLSDVDSAVSKPSFFRILKEGLWGVGLICALFLATTSAKAENCRKQVTANGEQATICCDGNGVCYRR
jgi:hypothetical protein